MRRLAMMVGLVFGTWILGFSQNADTAEVIVVENKSDIDDIEFINRRFRIDNFSQDRIIHVKATQEDEQVAEVKKEPKKSNTQPIVQTINSSSSSGGGGGSYSSSSSASKKKKRKRNRKRIRLKKTKKKRMGKRAACFKF